MQPAFSYHEVTEKHTLIEMLPWGFGSIQCGFKSFASGLGLKAIPVDAIRAKNNLLGPYSCGNLKIKKTEVLVGGPQESQNRRSYFLLTLAEHDCKVVTAKKRITTLQF